MPFKKKTKINEKGELRLCFCRLFNEIAKSKK